ncbi:MAG: hypothetical protein M1838_005327, partial [Thelocarpon superellum]
APIATMSRSTALTGAAYLIAQLIACTHASPLVLQPRQTNGQCQYQRPNSNENCYAFAARFSISLSTLQSLNAGQIDGQCDGFGNSNQQYCVPISSTSGSSSSTNCRQAQPQSGDTCSGFAQRNNIQVSQLISWNAGRIDNNCDNLNFAEQYCVAAPSGQSSTGFGGCTQQIPQPGDSCDAFSARYSINTQQLRSYNQNAGQNNINGDCTNLMSALPYCVTAPSQNGVPSGSSTEVVTCQPETPQSGDTCSSFANRYSISTSQLVSYNSQPNQNNLASGCSWIDPTKTYCITQPTFSGGSSGGSTVESSSGATVVVVSGSSSSGSSVNGVPEARAPYCKLAATPSNDGELCTTFASNNGLDPSQVGSYNSGLSCTSSTALSSSSYYCLSPPYGGASSIPAPGQTGVPGNTPSQLQGAWGLSCSRVLKPCGESCTQLPGMANIDPNTFQSWNPSISNMNSCAGFSSGNFYCLSPPQ